MRREILLKRLVFVLVSFALIALPGANGVQADELNHNCRFWGMIAPTNPSDQVLDHLVNGANSIENLSALNSDGWGIAYYPDGSGVPMIYRGTLRANVDPAYNVAADATAASGARIAVAHVRNASSGLIPATGDPHPFERVKDGRNWLFGHNGTISKTVLLSLIRPAYLAANPPLYGSGEYEWIDSDLYMILIMQTLEDMNFEVKPALGYVVRRLREEIGGSGGLLNFFFTDGNNIWAYRQGNTLWYTYESTGSPFSAVASQYPMSTPGNWVELSDGDLITMSQSGAPVVEDIADYFGSSLLADNYFDDVLDDADLRADGSGQDWYESRTVNPELLTLNSENIGGNTGSKAALAASSTGNAYLSQEFTTPQTGTFTVQWDIYIDSIADISSPDRAGIMLIGDESHVTSPGPNSDNSERFVYLAFLRDGGGGSGTMDLVARDRDDDWTAFSTITTGLNIDQWYTIKVVCDVPGGVYDVYVDDVYQATVSSRNEKTSVTHISFAQWNDGAGSFYVDNVYEATVETFYTLTMAVDPDGSGTITPAIGDHTFPEGEVVTLTATPAEGYDFSYWEGPVADAGLPITTVEMDGDHTVTAHFYLLPTDFLADNDFDASVDSDDLVADSVYQDWFESRDINPELLTLNTDDVGGNSTAKARMAASSTGNAYLSQEFDAIQTGTFAVKWDIYIDSIVDLASNPDRAGLMLIGDESHVTSPGPNSDNTERFVYLAFFKDGGGGSGTMDLLARDRDDGWTAFTTIATGLNLDQWYTIQVVCDLGTDTYDIYLDGVYQATVTSRIEKSSVSHISFAQWNDGAGTFYVDNVYQATGATYTLTTAVDPVGGGTTTPAEGDYVYADGTPVTVTAVPAAGYEFDYWDGDIADPNASTTTVVVDGDKSVTAHFSLLPEPLLVDGDFDVSVDTDDLVADSSYQDWYESRGANPELLTLNTDDVGGNASAKAAIAASSSGNVYLSQEFGEIQTGVSAVEWDIYIDSIVDISDPDRTGWMLIGDDSDPTRPGPNSDPAERFVQMAFFRDGGGGAGTMDLVARERGASFTEFTTVAPGLNLDQWYTIKVVCDLDADTYDVYVDGAYRATMTSYNEKASLSHISFAQWDDGAGAFYVDRVYEADIPLTYTLTMDVDPAGAGTTNPPAGMHDYPVDAVVTITAAAAAGYQFDYWVGDVADPNSATTTVEMYTDQSVTAYFTPTAVVFLADSDFDASIDTEDLRANSASQDWYESREDTPGLLTLNTDDVGGNTGKKAAFAASSTGNVYLSQEFGTVQAGLFAVQWDIYVDSIVDISDPDRAGWMLVGDDSDPTRLGPNSDPAERFVQMAFFRDGGGGAGTMDLMARERGAAFTEFTMVASGLNLDQWYTIKVVCDLDADTYDVYVDDVYRATMTSYNAKTSVSHISFAQWNDGAGAFYVDNVAEGDIPVTHSLSVSVIGSGSVTRDPDQTTYNLGDIVGLTAVSSTGWVFSHWSGDLAGSDNPTSITITGDMAVEATFTHVGGLAFAEPFESGFTLGSMVGTHAEWYDANHGPLVTAGVGIGGTIGLGPSNYIFSWSGHPFNWNDPTLVGVIIQMDYQTSSGSLFMDNQVGWMTTDVTATTWVDIFGVRLQSSLIRGYWDNSAGDRRKPLLMDLNGLLLPSTWYRFRGEFTKLTATSARIDITLTRLDAGGNPVAEVATITIENTAALGTDAPDAKCFAGTAIWPTYKNNGPEGGGGADNAYFEIILTGDINHRPEIVCPDEATVNVGSELTAAVSAADQDDDDVTITAGDLMAGATFDGATVTWTPDCTGIGEHTVRFVASDGELTDTCYWVVTAVDAVVPVVTCPPDVAVECGEPMGPEQTGFATATDNCDESPAVGYEDGPISDDVFARTWTASDASGNVSEPCVQTITIEDTTPPVVTCPSDILVPGGGSTHPDNTGYAAAVDVCDGEPTVSYADAQIGFEIARSWTAADASGNVSDPCIQMITVEGVWSAVIHAEGEYDEYATYNADVSVGVAAIGFTVIAPPDPVDHTVLLKLYGPDWSGPFIEDIRPDGMEGYRWVLAVNPHGSVPPATDRCATLNWDPFELSPIGYYQLVDLGMDGMGETVVISDMRTTTEYEVCGADATHYFAMLWRSAEFCVDVEMTAGWQLVSLPLVHESNDPATLFPGCIAAWGYDNESRQYVQVTEIEPCRGYWLNMEADATITLCGASLTDCSGTLTAGWHLAGGPDCVVAPETDPVECLLATWGYNTTTEAYEAAAEFSPSAGYWVKLGDECNLSLDCGVPLTRQITGRQAALGSDMAGSQITLTAYGADLEGASRADIVIGVDSIADTYPCAPAPPAYSVKMALYQPDWSGPYYEDIRIQNAETAQWIVAIDPHGNVAPPEARTATITWDPAEFGDGLYSLQEGYDGTGRTVVEDMKAVTELEVTGTHAEYYFTLLRTPGSPTGVDDDDPMVPVSYYLGQCYPNPFNPTTQIEFGIPAAGHAELTVYNIAGQKIVSLVDGPLAAGNHVVQWNGKDSDGQPVATGIYLYRLQVGDFTSTRKMVLLK